MLAMAIPIALHFLSRKEPRKVVFPSIQFLTQRHQTNKSRMRIRRWWLLALRILALTVVAIAFARPVIHRSLSLTWLTIGIVATLGVILLVLACVAVVSQQAAAVRYGLFSLSIGAILAAIIWGGVTHTTGAKVENQATSPLALAILIDNSPTLAWKSPAGDRLSEVRDLTKWILGRVPRASQIAIVDRSNTPVAFSLDRSGALASIEKVVPLSNPAPITTRLQAAQRILESSDLENRLLIVLSDFTKSNWQSFVDSETASSRILSDSVIPTRLFDLGEFSGVNRSLASVALSDDSPSTATPVSVSSVVSFHRGEAMKADGVTSQSVTVELEVYEDDPSLPLLSDGRIRRPMLRSVDRTSVQVGEGVSAEVVLTIPPLPIGSHHGRIRLVGDDPLRSDDVQYFSLHVRPPTSVLVVAQSEDEATIIAQTISAPLSAEDPAAEYQVQQIGYRDFGVVRLNDFSVVLLIDPPEEAATDERLSTFVQQNGGLFLSLGPSLSDSVLKSPEGVLPILARRWRVPMPGTFIQLSDTRHPSTEALTGIVGGVPWSDFRVNQYWQLGDSSDDFADRTLATYAGNNHVALIERQFLRVAQSGTDASERDEAELNNEFASPDSLIGRVLVLTTPLPALAVPTRSWNELFSGGDAWPAFLLVRGITDYLANPYTSSENGLIGIPRNLLISKRRSAASQDRTDVPVSEGVSKRLQLFPPGDVTPIPIDVLSDSETVSISSIESPGNYWLRGEGVHTGFSANMHEEATSIERIDRTDFAMDELSSSDSQEGHIQWIMARDELDLQGDPASVQVPLHSPAMLLALIVFIAEQVLSNRFYKKGHRTTSSVASKSSGSTVVGSMVGGSN